MSSTGVTVPGKGQRKLSAAQSFVLVHATAGVLRTLVASADTPPRREV